MIIPALPAIQHDVGASPEAATWLLTAFLLTSSVSTPLLGRLGDMYGKEKVLLAVLGVFALGSLVCAIGGSIGVLILGRAIQGAGGAIFPLAFGIIRDEFPRERVATSIGLISATFGIGGGLGLVLAGVIVDHLSVQWIFWSSVVVTSFAAWATWRYVPESPVRVEAKIDWAGAALLSLTLGVAAARRLAGQRLGLGLARRARPVRRRRGGRRGLRQLRAPRAGADGRHGADVAARRVVHEPHGVRDRLRDVRLLRADSPARGASVGDRVRLRRVHHGGGPAAAAERARDARRRAAVGLARLALRLAPAARHGRRLRRAGLRGARALPRRRSPRSHSAPCSWASASASPSPRWPTSWSRPCARTRPAWPPASTRSCARSAARSEPRWRLRCSPAT